MLGSGGGEGEANGAMGNLGVTGGSHENVRRLAIARSASGTSRDGDVGERVEVELDRFAFGGLEGGVEEVGEEVVAGGRVLECGRRRGWSCEGG